MKKVCFNDLVDVCNIDLEYDSVVYQRARSGQEWVNCAVDRCRFKDRINRCKIILNKVLDADHRCKMLKMLEMLSD